MTITYDVKSVALAVAVSHKWLDNLLSHNDLPGVQRARQGVVRRISPDGLLAIEVARILVSDLGMPVWRAAEIVGIAFQHRRGPDLTVVTRSGLRLDIPVSAIVPHLQQRIAEAMEAIPRVPRGRPPATGNARSLGKSKRRA